VCHIHCGETAAGEPNVRLNEHPSYNRHAWTSSRAQSLEKFVIIDLRRCILASTFVAAFVVAGAHDSFSQHHAVLPLVSVHPLFEQGPVSDSSTRPLYETRANHDPNGTGKFYMGREIAQVMGPGGIEWLDRPEREEEEHPAKLLDSLDLHRGEVVADLGAGSGYFTFRMAPRVGETGKVMAVEIQEAMLNTLRARVATMKATNVEVVQGTEVDPHLPVNHVDLVLVVDVYHELAYPFEVMTKVREALKPRGRVVFVEYRKEDPAVRIKEVHKMSVKQLEKEMNAVGLVRVRTVETLPLQHIVIFEKRN
jgi:ubiquinone/menaquinone biosynthesis C-methylase UbiE